MRILLFRHGPAEARDDARWPDDLLRPLTPEGVVRTRRAARGVARLEPGAASVWSSPATRCLETALLLADALEGSGEPVSLPSLAPEGDWRETERRLAREDRDARVAIVGHEPELSMLAAVLLGGRPAAFSFKKAGACALDWEEPSRGRAQLRWWLGPGALRAVKSRQKGRAV